MTQSIIQGSSQETTREYSFTPSWLSERWLRQGTSILILYLLLQAELGLAWDRNWHDLVGRDRFWIPPHILLYTGVGGAGLVALIVIFIETLRYARKHDGVDDTSTIPVLGYFHAPLGFVLLGFGALTDLLAAPLDNYWHELYGLDVTLWSPFHIMGTLGGVILGLGAIYMISSEAAYERQKGAASWRILGLSGPEWCAIILLAALIEIALPSLTAFTPANIGTFTLLTYPIPLTMAGVSMLIAIVQLTRKPGAATLMVCVLFLESLGTQSFVPWAIWTTIDRLGFTFRYPGVTPVFNVSIVCMPLVFLLGAIAIDVTAYRQWADKPIDKRTSLKRISLLGLIAAIPTVFLPPLIVDFFRLFPSIGFPRDVLLMLQPSWSDIFPVLLLILIVGPVFAHVGSAFGDIWHLSKQ